MKILVTGAAGFIGYHLCDRLLKSGHDVIGLDNINDYYDVDLKYARLSELGISRDQAEPFNDLSISNDYRNNFQFIRLNLEDRENLPKLFAEHKFEMVCNLAAQAGVRYSLENPETYIDSNIVGFLNLLECLRHSGTKKLVYASSSSIYGLNEKVPFCTDDNVDQPISLYAATKKSNELMAYTYSHLFGIHTIGLRFFTVYGSWGRPDMAMFLFTDAIINDKPIKVFNNGNLSRDFTYIDDIIDGVVSILSDDSRIEKPLYELYNIGNSKPVKLMDFISEIENCTNKRAKKIFLPMQPGDVEKTWADVTNLKKNFSYTPKTDVSVGVKKYVEWHEGFYKNPIII